MDAYAEALNRTSASAMIFCEAIAAVFKFSKIASNARMIDCLAAKIFFEIGLGNVSAQTSATVN
jgi:hypothetical protein